MAPFEIKNTFAVIGVGLIGPRYCRTVIKSSDAHLIAIVDLAPRGAELAKELGTNYYKTVQDLVTSPHKPDAAIICTPNHTHVAVVKELIEEGIHVLVRNLSAPIFRAERTC